MKLIILLMICWYLTASQPMFSQDEINGTPTFELVMSILDSISDHNSINLRLISPKFQLTGTDHYWTNEEEKHPEKFNKARIMFEFLYAPLSSLLAASLNLQYRLLEYRRINVQLFGGLKYFFLSSPDYLLFNERIWYLNNGILTQVDLGIISPFIDIGIDKIFTIGTEVDLNRKTNNTKKRYNLHLRKTNSK